MSKKLKAKKDLKDKRKNLKIEKKDKETKKDFIEKLGKQICGEGFKIPVVY